MAPATDQLTAPPAAPSLPPGYDPNTGTVPAASQGTAPAPSPTATPATMEAAPEPRNYERLWDAIQEGIPLFNKKFETTGVQEAYAEGEAKATGKPQKATPAPPKMQLITPQAAMTPKEQAEHPILTETGKVAGGFTSPGNMILLAGTSGLGSIAETAPWAIKLIPKLAQAGFTAQALDAAYDQIPALKKAWDAGDEKGVEAALTDSVLNTAAGIAAGAYPEETGKGGKVGAIQPLEHGALPEGKVLDVEGRVVDEGKPHPIAEPTLPKGESPAKEQLAGKLDDLGTRLPDLQTAEMRNPNATFGRTGGPFGRAVDITHQVLRQNEAEANAPTIEHREVSTYGSGSEAPQPMQQVRLRQNGKTIGRVNYVIDPDTNIASVKAQGIDDPNLRGKGYGQQMVLAAADQARAHGATALTSDLQGTTSMDAARVWDKLAAKGHPVEKIPSKAGSPGYSMDLTKPSPLPQYGQAASEQGNLPGQKVQLGDLGAKYVGRETPQIKTPEIVPAYHPDLQKVADQYGVVNSPSGETEASFITPDGKFIRLPAGVTHDYAIDDVRGATSLAPGPSDNRIGFLNDTGAIRVRMSNDRAGKTAHISVPAGGVTEEQIPAVQQAIAAAGRNGNVVMERADVTPETKDQLTMSKEFPRPSDAADYLRQIQAHPDQHAVLQTNEKPSNRTGRNEPVGFINPQGEFERFNQLKGQDTKGQDYAYESTHEDFASNRNTTQAELLKKGWVRKAGQGSYQTAQLNPQTQKAIENDILSNYGDLTGRGRNPRVSSVVLEVGNKTYVFSPQDFVEKYNGDLQNAIQGEGEDLQTNERQSPLKEPYAIEMRNPDGTIHTETVEGFSIKDAIKTAQKKFPDATEWSSVDTGGVRTPSTEYSVPTGKLLSTPPVMGKSARDFYGRSKEDAAAEDAAATLRTMYHELGGHGMIGLKEGMTPKGVVRHTHPDASSDTRAAVSWDASGLYQPGTRRFKPDKVDAVVKNFMGGPAADEVFSGVPRAANHNFDYTARGSDGYQAYNALRDAGYNHDDALARMHEMVDENKEYLTKPEVSGVIKENVGVREPGLSTQYHHSPERMQNMHAEIQRRIKANGANTEDINNGAAGGGGTQDHPAVVARGEGGISETAGQVPGEVAKTPAAEAAPEVNPHDLVERAQRALEAGDKKTAASLLAQARAALQSSELTTAEKAPLAAVTPNKKLQQSAQEFAKTHGMDEINHDPVQTNPERATEIARIYHESKHDPTDPRVKAAYDALKSETKAQFDHLRATGLKFEPTVEDPYKSAGEMMTDIRDNNRLKVYTGGADLPKDHPLAEVDPKTGQTYNTLFRWVHDAYGHAAGGNDFSENGEKSATEAHAQMYSDAARPAMRAETEGQTSWFFHNPDVAAGKTQPGEFAAQKATILPDEPRPWNEVASKAMAKSPAGAINPHTAGASDTTGVGVEVYPEARANHEPLDHAPTPQDVQKFYDENRKLFKKYPELRLGWDKTSKGWELNIGAAGTREGAIALGKKLDQRAVWDIDKQKEISTGGKGRQTEFPDYPMDERLRDLAPKEPGQTISTRYPSAVAATEDPLRHGLALSGEKTLSDPKMVEKYANEVKDYPGFTPPKDADAKGTVSAFINHVKDNLEWLYKQSTPAEQEANEGWYDGAHQLTKDLADQHGYTHMQTAGVVAALSPQKDWDMNVSLAKRLTDIVKNHADEKASPEMIQKGKDIVSQTQEVNPKANAALQKMFNKIKGKSLDELTDPTQRAAWVRLYDEANNPREVEKIGPDGKPQGLRTNLDGSPTRVAWSSLNTINKALSILNDGSRENISRTLGGAHKVRSFYNNIIDPNSKRGDVTIDTHAVAAGLLRPLGGFDSEVVHNFNSPKSSVTGLTGTYPLYHAAYTEAAKDLDIPYPRMLQSVIWEKIRNLFPTEFKTAEHNDAINAIWKEHEDGSITADQARTRILDYAKSHAPVSEGQRAGIDKGELPLRGVHGESAEGYERSGVSAGNPLEDDTSFNFGANAPEELPPTPQPKPKKMKGAVSAMSLLSGLKKAGSKPK